MEDVYKILAEIRILHDYHVNNKVGVASFYNSGMRNSNLLSYRLSDFLEIRPTVVCRQKLKSYRLLFRMTKTGFRIIAQVKELLETETIIRFLKSEKFSFYLIAKDPFLLNYTNIPLEALSGKIFYFNNLQANVLKKKIELAENNQVEKIFKFLSTPLQDYTEGDSYKRGDLIGFSGEVYEVIGTGIPPDKPSENASNYWKEVKSSQFVTEQDLRAIKRNSITISLANEHPEEVHQLEIMDILDQKKTLGNKNIPGAEIPEERVTFPKAEIKNFDHQMSLRNLDEGLYKVGLNEKSISEFYHLSQEVPTNLLGLIELFYLPEKEDKNQLPQGYDFTKINIPTGRTQNPIFFYLHFKNRETIWRYHTSDDIKELGKKEEESKFFPLQKEWLAVSDEEILGGELLPNPSVKRVSIEKVENKSIKIYSDVYL